MLLSVSVFGVYVQGNEGISYRGATIKQYWRGKISTSFFLQSLAKRVMQMYCSVLSAHHTLVTASPLGSCALAVGECPDTSLEAPL